MSAIQLYSHPTWGGKFNAFCPTRGFIGFVTIVPELGGRGYYTEAETSDGLQCAGGTLNEALRWLDEHGQAPGWVER